MWFRRLLHLISYTIGVFMITSTWLSTLPVYEQVFRTGIVLYLSIIYIEFVDGSMLGRLKPSVLFEEKAKREERDEIENLIQASRMSLYWIRLVQQSETETERELNLIKLEQHIAYIKSMSLPKRYKKDHSEILSEVQGFLSELTKNR